MYAFLCHQSACEALRYLRNDVSNQPAWPPEPRLLPRYGDCVSTQHSFGLFCQEVDLASFGITSLPVHMLVPSAGSRSRGKRAKFHVWQKHVPAHAMVRIGERVIVSAPAFILMQMAAQNYKADPIMERFVEKYHANQAVSLDGWVAYDDPFEWARMERLVRMALVACEFAGSYRLAVGGRDTAYGLASLITCEGAYDFAKATPHPYGIKRMRAALGLAFDCSASPMESALALMLTLPVEMGGFALPRPTLNEGLPTGRWETFWDGGDTVTPDLLWRDAHLAIEYESDEFHGSQGPRKATSDASRGNVLAAMGYTVLRATTGTVASLHALERLAGQVAAHLGIMPAPSNDVAAIRRQRLHTLLVRHGRPV